MSEANAWWLSQRDWWRPVKRIQAPARIRFWDRSAEGNSDLGNRGGGTPRWSKPWWPSMSSACRVWKGSWHEISVNGSPRRAPGPN